MASTKGTDSPPTKSPGAESPTTVKPLDMDDDDVQETPALGGDSTATTTAPATAEHAPPKPPRPLNPQQEAENTLKEAFPGVDAAVVKAVLIASGGRVEPAFNALLGMTDPDAIIDPTPPPQPPRPSAGLSQVEADEQYARQLAEHYDASAQRPPRSSSRTAGVPQQHQRNPQRGQNLKPNELHDENYSFIDDDLPVIRENLRKGFIETQTKVNSWITNLKKRIDGDDLGEIRAAEASQNPGYYGGPSGGQQYGARRSGDTGRRSGDSGRYDADPQVLGDDFAGIQLNEDTHSQSRRSTRPLANPDLFKPTPTPPRSSDGRKVSFSPTPSPDDRELYRTSPRVPAKDASAGKHSKWQPLSAVEPSPVGDADNDPFSLGDSEDEKEIKKDSKAEDADKPKKTTSSASQDETDVGGNDKIAADKGAEK